MKRTLLISVMFLHLLVGDVMSIDYIASKGIGMGGTLLLSQPSATTLVDVPCGNPVKSAWLIESGYNRRFELAELDHVFVAAAGRWSDFTVSFGASQFGTTGIYAEQLLKGSVVYHFRQFTFGTSLSAMKVRLGLGYSSLRAATFGLGVAMRLSSLAIAIEADNLTRPELTPTSPGFAPVYSIYSELKGRGSYSITGRITMEEEQETQFAIGQMIALSKRGSFFWGISTAPMEYGGGLAVKIASGSVAYAASVHPVLGLSHTISFSYGSSGSSLPATADGDEFDNANRY